MTDLDEFLRDIENKRLLVVFPHPDDETFMAGGLIQRAHALGYIVEVICLTRGERGQNFRRDLDWPLEQIRIAEFKSAMKSLGVNYCQVWSYPDGNLRKNKAWFKEITKFIGQFKPGLLVSYEHSGLTGHPDHIVLGVELFQYLSTKFPQIKLLWPVWPGRFRTFMAHPETRDLIPAAEYKLRLTLPEKMAKLKAMHSHRSQLGNWSPVQHLLMFLYRHEYFSLANYQRDYAHRFVEFKID